MREPIESVLSDYVAITSEQVRYWSAGKVKRRLRRYENKEDWHDVSGTLWDQSIFGPAKDWQCACEQFKGMDYSGMVCPICRVKVGLRRARQFRFGHINLSVVIPHPFIAESEGLDAIPVVPACYWETRKGRKLAEAYEELLRCSLIESTVEELVGVYGQILAHLERIYRRIPAFREEEAERVARGMALKPRPPAPEDSDEVEIVDWGELRLADD